MTIEVTILIAAISATAAVVSLILSTRRNDKHDIVAEVTKTAEIGANLKSISEGVAEIKADMKNVREDVNELRERVVRAEDSARSAHKRLDELKAPHGSEVDR